MRPDLQQGPRPEYGLRGHPDAPRARHDDAPAGPQDPWSGGQPPVGPYTGPVPTPTGYTGPQPTAGPYPGRQADAPGPATTGSWTGTGRGRAASPADPTVRHPRRGARTDHDSREPAGHGPDHGHPSGPLPVGHGHHRGGERRGAGRGRRWVILALIAVASVIVGAAGYVAVARWGPSSDASAAPPAPAAAGAAVTTSLTGPNLATRQTPIGLVATNDGFTVYEYAKDTNKPPKATCTDACATAWPPVLAGDAPWLKGVSAEKVGSVDRPDGTKQLTLNGWPLYRHAKDTKPGDTNGNGVGGSWKALGPEGKPVAGAPGPAGAASPAGGDGAAGSRGSGSGSGTANGGSSGY